VFYKEIMSDNEMNGVTTPTQLQNTRPVDDYRATEEFVAYERLCRGEETIVSTTVCLSLVACHRCYSFDCWLGIRPVTDLLQQFPKVLPCCKPAIVKSRAAVCENFRKSIPIFQEISGNLC